MKRFIQLTGVAVLVAFILMCVGLFMNEQAQVSQQAVAAQTAAVNQKAAVHQKLNDCLDSVNKATNAALTPEKTAGLSGTTFNSYTQSVLQIQQSQITECQARYSTP